MTYEAAKFIHVIGVVLLLGNVTATAIWKLFADRSGDPKIISFAQRLIILTDWSLTFWGVLLMMLGGYAAVAIGRLDYLQDRWLVTGQLLFVVSGAVWIGVLIPLQIKMAKMSLRFANGGPISSAYIKASRAWLFVGVTATVPLIAAAWVMIAKPS